MEKVVTAWRCALLNLDTMIAFIFMLVMWAFPLAVEQRERRRAKTRGIGATRPYSGARSAQR